MSFVLNQPMEVRLFQLSSNVFRIYLDRIGGYKDLWYTKHQSVHLTTSHLQLTPRLPTKAFLTFKMSRSLIPRSSVWPSLETLVRQSLQVFLCFLCFLEEEDEKLIKRSQ